MKGWEIEHTCGMAIVHPRPVVKVPLERPAGITDAEWSARMIEIDKEIALHNALIEFSYMLIQSDRI